MNVILPGSRYWKMRQPIEYINLNRIEYRSKLVLLQTASNLLNKYLFSITIAYILFTL